MYERFIARQPIFDHRLKVFGYELLFRGSQRNSFEPSRRASTSVIVESTTLFDLQALTGNAKAFINADTATLLSGALRLLPPERIVVEILENVDPTAEVVQACKDLSALGYVMALDDFIDHPRWQPLIPLVEFIKVDFLASGAQARADMAHSYRRRGIELVAEKVETQAALDEARSVGYNYFQGYFFCKPAVVEARDIPGSKLNFLRLLECAAAPELDYQAVEEVFRLEPGLIYKLLRYLNSPLLGLAREIRSIREAIQLLGESEFRRWISIVAVVAMADDKPPELVRTALQRAYFCEELSQPVGMTPQRSDLFLMGLLSVADALLDRPIAQILAQLPVFTEVRSALCGDANRFRDVYDALLSYERADWAALSAISSRTGFQEDKVQACYDTAAVRASSLRV